MRIFLTLLLTTAIICMFVIPSCGGNGDGDDTPPPPAPPPQTPSSDTDYSGTDPDELLTKWAELGENAEDIQTWLDPESDGTLMDIMEWHISGIDEGFEVTYEMELDKGAWIVHGFGGTGLAQLDMYAYGENPSAEPLDSDTFDDNYPLLHITLDDTEKVEFVIDPVRFEEGADKAFYCWFIYTDE